MVAYFDLKSDGAKSNKKQTKSQSVETLRSANPFTAQLGVKNNAKILSSRVCVEEGKSLGVELMAEEERFNRLNRVKVMGQKGFAFCHGHGFLHRNMNFFFYIN